MVEILKGIPITAEDWQLFSSMPGADAVAKQIAEALSEAIRKHYTPDIALDLDARCNARTNISNTMHRVMRAWSKFGATDSEPCWILSRLLDTAFPIPSDY